jgi:hypothetical protein
VITEEQNGLYWDASTDAPITEVTELLEPDSDVLEMICNENADKDRPHLPIPVRR